MQRSLRFAQASPGSLRARFLHSSSATPNPTPVLNRNSEYFSMLPVTQLKAECRRRGLKVSGKKSSLIDRILSYDSMSFASSTPSSTARKLTTTTPRRAKDDASTIDFYKMPDMYTAKEEVPVQIPIITNKYRAPLAEVPSYPPPEILQVSGANVVVANTAGSATPGGAPAYEGPGPDELDQRDKVVLTSILAGTLAWFGLGKLTEDRK
ncbi:uncharacterized protein V1518DRAFT_424786 [Limtongia smithiae]|uniref:uncharacterized protein n=1 Tax=Limtongia smithiae TaxID=1125753 RepID=UPI0034CD11A1